MPSIEKLLNGILVSQMILTSLLATNCFAVLVLKLIIIFKSSTMTHNSWVLWIVHLIFEINVGEGRIRHRTTPKFNFLIDSKWIEDGVIWIWSSSISDPTLTDIDSKINWLGSELPLKSESKYLLLDGIWPETFDFRFELGSGWTGTDSIFCLFASWINSWICVFWAWLYPAQFKSILSF